MSIPAQGIETPLPKDQGESKGSEARVDPTLLTVKSEALNPEWINGTVRMWLAYSDGWPSRGHYNHLMCR